jgi:hypothetical protein
LRALIRQSCTTIGFRKVDSVAVYWAANGASPHRAKAIITALNFNGSKCQPELLLMSFTGLCDLKIGTFAVSNLTRIDLAVLFIARFWRAYEKRRNSESPCGPLF